MNAISPLKYKISITPDLESFTFTGHVTIDFLVTKPVSRIILNSLELGISKCELSNKGESSQLNHTIIRENETLLIELPATVENDISVSIMFKGSINDKMAGFYRSSYMLNGEKKYIAITQFQESSARMAFPCMDHPVHKAVFELELVIPPELSAISNTLPDKEEIIDTNSKRIIFKPTPKMSTYLLFFGVGVFEILQDATDSRIRLFRLPGSGNTEEPGLTYGRQSLKYCEDYYGIPYPLEKMDLIAVPDFAFGAMENWGAVTFRENLLLHFEGITSKAGRQRIFEVIAHETAHQWFGNLVTPEDWKYLWLNESFATYFGYGVLAHYHPEWDIWQQFLHVETSTALARDGLQETFAIEIPCGDHVVINTSTAPIIYNKGAGMLRMLEGYIGSESYKKGVRKYLSAHQYECADSGDLWNAFEETSSQPVSGIIRSWISQPGYPLITAERHEGGLLLHQKRFSYLQKETGQKWKIPVTLSVWDKKLNKQEFSFLFSDEKHLHKLPPDCLCYKINNGQTGFFRVQYAEKSNLFKLGEMIRAHSLSPEDRWGIQNDLYALVRNSTCKLDDYLDFLKYYDRENAYLPLISICSNLLLIMLVCRNNGDRISETGRNIAERIFKDIGFIPSEDEPVTRSGLRDQLLWYAILWDLPEAVEFTKEKFIDLKAGRYVHPDILKAIMQSGAWIEGGIALEWFVKRFSESPSEHERINVLNALGSFKNRQLLEKALSFTLEKVPPRNRYMTIASASINPEAATFLWDWYVSNLYRLEEMHPLLYERVIASVWPFGGLGREDEVSRFGYDYVQKHPEFKDSVKLALENLEINKKMNEENSA